LGNINKALNGVTVFFLYQVAKINDMIHQGQKDQGRPDLTEKNGEKITFISHVKRRWETKGQSLLLDINNSY